MKIGIIIQARLGSTRLPNKILLPFYEDKCILDILLTNLQKLDGTEIIVATSDNPTNDILAEYLKKKKIEYFRGDENNVLERFICAAKKYDIDGIIRICSDNPFMDVSGLITLIDKAKNNTFDYIGFRVNEKPSIKSHFGFWAEYVSLNALERVRTYTDEKVFHEHVTNYIYTNPDNFTIEWINAPTFLEGREDIRLTIDTKEDFEIAKQIYNHLVGSVHLDENFSIANIISYIDENPNIIYLMKLQIKNNTK